jgi:hypothetical protein
MCDGLHKLPANIAFRNIQMAENGEVCLLAGVPVSR